ncbi:MAG: diaminopimelate epimerase [Dermabacter sp.]|nr:diaminopimelate epimerase [Dermabacter sp.]
MTVESREALEKDPRLSYASATRNDFVMIDDPDGTWALDAGAVRALAGPVGTDGIIRAVRTAAAGEEIPGVGAALSTDDADLGTDDARRGTQAPPEWFMDYRNADGSLAQMCGNGVRAFAAFLSERGYVNERSFDIATRAGLRHVDILEAGPNWRVRVGMGPARLEGPVRRVQVGERWFEAEDVNVGNPHTVVQLPEEIDLESLDLTEAPPLDPVPTEGTNIEFVQRRGTRHVAMRVFERGVGETLSCGTGATAVAAATAHVTGDASRANWQVDVRGGTLTLGWDELGEMTLMGPAELSALGAVGPRP